MRTAAMALLAVILLSTGQIGCSKKQESDEKTESQSQVAVTKEPITLVEAEDLAAKSHLIRDENNKFVTIVTGFGNMTFELYRDVAPTHVDSFVARTTEGFYDGIVFHKVIDRYMIQGGDPQGTGRGNTGYFLQAEFSDLPHKDGTLSMARSTSPNSASCQFFICLGRNQKTKDLDGSYTVFGQLLKGYDVLHKIGAVECIPDPHDGRLTRPKEDVVMSKVFLSDAEGNEL